MARGSVPGIRVTQRGDTKELGFFQVVNGHLIRRKTIKLINPTREAVGQAIVEAMRELRVDPTRERVLADGND